MGPPKLNGMIQTPPTGASENHLTPTEIQLKNPTKTPHEEIKQ